MAVRGVKKIAVGGKDVNIFPELGPCFLVIPWIPNAFASGLCAAVPLH